MSKVNRNLPKRTSASESRYALFEFERDFPDDAACLEYLVKKLYPNGITCTNPKCPHAGEVTRHHREHARPSYSCQFCGHREHPMVGTIFQDSATSLRLWFYGIYLMSSTRCGISAKQLERELGVTYKTAWRMFNKIRSLMAEDPGKLSGTVEVDETYIGGKLRTVHLPEGTAGALLPLVHEHILPASMIYTDELPAYAGLKRAGYQHRRVNHSAKVYVEGDVHTSTIDGFWALLKHGLRGVYHGVSAKHLPSYLNEYVFRYNNRENGRGMFNAMISRVQKTSQDPS